MQWIKNSFKTISINSLNSKKQKQFGYLFSAFLILFSSISIYKNGLIFNTKQNIALVLLVFFITSTLFFSKGLYPLLFIWFSIGELLGKVSSFTILAFIYFAIFTPITFVLNILNKKIKYRAKWVDRSDTINYENLS